MVKKVVTKTVTKTEHAEDGTVKETKTEEEPKVVEKSAPKKSGKKKLTAGEREEMLIQNFVGLQHAMTNLSIKFGTLSDNLSELLRVFEGAARSFSKGDEVDNADMLKKIDSLLDQNKTIAKGLVLMEGKLRSKSEEPGYHGYHGHEEHVQPSVIHPQAFSQVQHGMNPSIAEQENSPREPMRHKPLPEL